MNKTGIEWSDYSWNPITGCRHGCEYCYAERMTKRFSGDVRNNMLDEQCETSFGIFVLDTPFKTQNGTISNYPFGFLPTYHKYRLDWPEKVKNGVNIFVGSMADIFGAWIPDCMIREIFDHCRKYKQHNYLFLTKNPHRYIDLASNNLLPEDKNMWFGTSTPTPDTQFFYSDKHNTFLSIEPLLSEFDSTQALNTNWVIIGAETGNRKNKVIPKKQWIDNIVSSCRRNNIPVFMKDSLIPIIGEKNMLREFPKQLDKKIMSEKQRNRLFDKCMYCGCELRMKDMIALLYREKRGESSKRLGYVCKTCFKVNLGGALSEKTQLQNDE